jgi:murein peptide amidase A
MRRRIPIAVAAAALVLAGCSGDDETATTTVTEAPVFRPATRAPTPPPPTIAATTSTSTGPTSTSTSTSTSTTTSTTVPGAAGLAVDALQVAEIGRSRDGRAIRAIERGTRGGTPVLVIGVIHGDEPAGADIVDRLATLAVPAGIDLWLVESMNPDGQAAGQRGNAAGVDLNRNFPAGWGPIGAPGDGQFAGTGPASEPETQAIIDLVTLIDPQLAIFYHQDLDRLSPSTGLEGRLKQRYSERTGLPIERITGGTYTGVAATWIRTTTRRPSFIVELGPTLSPEQADTHAAAVLDIATLAASS